MREGVCDTLLFLFQLHWALDPILPLPDPPASSSSLGHGAHPTPPFPLCFTPFYFFPLVPNLFKYTYARIQGRTHTGLLSLMDGGPAEDVIIQGLFCYLHNTFYRSVVFLHIFKHISCTRFHTLAHTCDPSRSAATTSKKWSAGDPIDRSCTILPRPQFPLSAGIHLFTASIQLKVRVRSWRGLRQYLVNNPMSAGKGGIERKRERERGAEGVGRSKR